MREIKFRAWDKRINDWFRFGGGFAISWDATEIMDDNDATEDISNDIVLQQFTGLHDKNNVEIYEGDIIQNVADDGTRLTIFEVLYDVYRGGFCKDSTDTNDRYMLGPSKFYEVLGNIYQHPELLKQEPVTPHEH